MPEKEIRSFPIELRKDGEGVKLAGMPIVYGKKSEDMGFIEYIDAGAAKKALKKSDVRALYGHNSDTLLPIGRQSAKTLRLKEIDGGVDAEIDPPKRNPFVDALIESIERGDIREMSFGFSVAKDEWTYPKNNKDPVVRHIIEFEQIYDISYVAFAAYNDTSVALRKMEEGRKNIPPEGGENIADPAIMNGLYRARHEQMRLKINEQQEVRK
ncbi:MAG: HK97 family phage prohead protease [Dehalococcoidia bacterium]|jgi:hypothetical protein